MRVNFSGRLHILLIVSYLYLGLTLLSTVSRKVGALFGMSNFELDKDREERAKDLYQTYVSNYRSKIKFKDAEVEPTGDNNSNRPTLQDTTNT